VDMSRPEVFDDMRGACTRKHSEQMLTDGSPSGGLLVVDDHGIVREGLIAMLSRQDRIRVLGAAASGEEAILAAQRLKPDIIVMDLMLPDMSGIDATQRVLALLPLTRIIILSACRTIEHVYHALRAGALGYVAKDAPPADLELAVNAALDGKQFISAQLMLSSIDAALSFSRRKSPLERLSGRERGVLRGIVAGSTSAAIAQQLSLSRKTVDTYRGRLMAKLGVCNRSALIRFALENSFTA
jgi:DNA-binding NarL/FixJ family response regulator